MQATKPKEEQEPPKEQPCIFGKAIVEFCPVRKQLAITRANEPDISKWIKPQNRDKWFDHAENLLDKMTSDMYYEYNTLVSFCDVCPFLVVYLSKNANNP